MQPIRLRLVVPWLLAAGLLLGCSGDDSDSADPPGKKKKAPAGVIKTKQAQAVPLNITRANLVSRLREQPVTVKQQRSRRTKAKLSKFPPKARRELQERFGKAKNGTVTIPAQTFTCLLYRGEKPTRFGWQFCFGKSGVLEYVSSTPALKSPSP